MDTPRLLIVEDDDEIGEALREILTGQGYNVVWEHDGRGALSNAAGFEPDLVVLDLGLPDLDGIEVCRRLRRHHPATVILILTARREEVDAVLGLDAGADDFVTKPFRLAELLARVRAHLRRVEQPSDDILEIGPLAVDRAARRVTLNGEEIDLRPKEYEVLELLAERAGRAVTREQLMQQVWATDWMGSSKTLDVHISSLRAKLGDMADQIVTLRGVGYRLEAP